MRSEVAGRPAAAIAKGMVTLKQEGAARVAQGVTQASAGIRFGDVAAVHGLEGTTAAQDIRELRDLLEAPIAADPTYWP